MTYRSPYTRCRFRHGLAVGVLSLRLPAFSKSFSAFARALGSTGSAPSCARWRFTELSGKYIVRFVGMLGGVFDPGGDTIFEMCDRIVSLATVPFPAFSEL